MTESPASHQLSELTRIALLSAVSLVLFLFESAIPVPLPWLKPGLANFITLLALEIYGFRTALFIAIVRIITAGLILGTFFTPVFILAFCGGMSALIVMGGMTKWFRNKFSLIGISIAGAFTHNAVQLALAAFIIIGERGLLVMLPLMTVASLFSGFLVGIFAHYTSKRWKNPGWVGN